MTTQETTAVLTTRDQITKEVSAEMLEQNGNVYPFGFTENLFFVDGRVWHEFKMLDDGELHYAFVDDHGNVVSCLDLEEVRDYYIER